MVEKNKTENQNCDGLSNELTCVMKFGGSSVASADMMREVADLILRFPEERPVIVLSAMGKTTNKLLLVYIFLTMFDILFYHFVHYFSGHLKKMPTEIGCVCTRLEKRLSVVVFLMFLISMS